MLTKPISEYFRGPLGSHRNYISHIALPNCVEYFMCKSQHQEQGQTETPAKYAEIRLFLNAIESLNNVPEYLFYEHGEPANSKGLPKFLQAMRTKFPILAQVADLANAYKHCGRRHDGGTQARDLQRTDLTVQISVGLGVVSSAEYAFTGPLPGTREGVVRSVRILARLQQ